MGAIWLWRKRKSERCVTAFNLEYSTADQEFNVTKEWPGDRVLCAVQFGDYHVLGTKVGCLMSACVNQNQVETYSIT